MKKCISIALAVVVIFSSMVFAYGNETDEIVQYNSHTHIYWAKENNGLEKVFKGNNIRNIDTIQSIQLKSHKEDIVAEYSISLFKDLIKTVGNLHIEMDYEGNEWYTGTLTGNCIINTIKCDVYAVVSFQKETQKLNAGITIIPLGANDLSDFVFLGIGDKIGNNQECKPSCVNDVDLDVYDSNISLSSNSYYDGFVLKYSYYAGFGSPSYGVAGTATALKSYYNQTAKRISVELKSYSSAIESYFSDSDIFCSAVVDTMKIGLTTPSGYNKIDGIYDFPGLSGGNPKSLLDPFTDAFINTVIDISAAHINPAYHYATAAIQVFKNFMNALKSKSGATYLMLGAGTNASVAFNYNQSIWNTTNAKYDTIPMEITFSVDTTISGLYTYTAQSEMTYFVNVADVINNTSTILSIPSNNISLSGTYYVSN